MRAALTTATIFAVFLVSAVAGGTVLTAGNTVPASRAGSHATPIGADTLKPAACASIALTTLVSGIAGTTGADLLLGTAATETMLGMNGNDCVLGGGGDDVIDGGVGTDVCIGGPGIDTFVNCETQIQ